MEREFVIIHEAVRVGVRRKGGHRSHRIKVALLTEVETGFVNGDINTFEVGGEMFSVAALKQRCYLLLMG